MYLRHERAAARIRISFIWEIEQGKCPSNVDIVVVWHTQTKDEKKKDAQSEEEEDNIK